MLLLWITIALSLTLAGFAQYYLRQLPSFHLRTTATLFMVGGLAIRLIAVFSLGKAFSANVAIRQSQQLNQSGVYRFIRHPSYLGLVLIFIAIGLHSGNMVSLVCACVPTTAALLYRINIEEAALLYAFAPQYETYRRRTKRLLPWVY
jgi:protein-S-isoprenylcysteine O-methyltransferase Ste14